MGYKFYYRDVEQGSGAWKSADEQEFPSIKANVAFHVSTVSVSETMTKNDSVDRKIKRRGDLWIDIDNKHKGTKVANIEQSIEDVRAVYKYLVSLNVKMETCSLFASGGKGFHICIPAKTMSAVALTSLNKVYKGVAKHIEQRTGVVGIDYDLYKGGMGSLIRVENKQRSDKNYKVPLAWVELDDMDVEGYYRLVSAPRPSIELAEPENNSGMIGVFNESLSLVNQEERLKLSSAVSDTALECVKGTATPCFTRLLEWNNLKVDTKDGLFNLANQTFARGIANLGFSEREVEEHIKTFADNSISRKRPTVSERERDIRYAINSAITEEKKFSCGYFKDILGDLPCNSCPVKLEQTKERANILMIEEVGNTYLKPPSGKRTETIMLADFRLEPKKVSYELDDSGNPIEQVYTFILHYSDERTRSSRCSIPVTAFQSRSKFKEAIKFHPQAIWYGKDEDVDVLRKYITHEDMLEGVEKVVPIKKLGVSRIIDTILDVDEYVWVQMGWSWNGAVPNTVEYVGPRNIGDTGEVHSCAVNLKEVTAMETSNSAHVFRSLLRNRGPKEVAILLGWMGACWLKPYLTSGAFDAMFPILHAYGVAGSGKTDVAKNFAILAGYDGIANETINVNNCTPYFLKATACSTTTIPHIFDEYNSSSSTKTNEDVKKAVREVIKSTATKQVMGKGRVTGSGEQGGVVTETTIASSPLIMLSTAQNQEAEIIERSVILFLNKDDIYRNPDKQFTLAHDEVMKARYLLFNYAKMLMHKSISITDTELTDYWNNTEWLSKVVSDQRKQKGMRIIATGLQFVQTALLEAGCSMETLELVKYIADVGFKAYLDDPRYRHLQDTGRNETDNVVDMLVGMAQLDDPRGDGQLLKEGIHYIVESTRVHLKLNSIYVHFKRYTKDMGVMVEYDTVKGFVQALENCGYYLGSGKTAGVTAPLEWHTFSIQGLIDKDIDISRLTIK